MIFLSKFKGICQIISNNFYVVKKVGDNKVSGKIPEQLIEQIRSQSDIVDVISDYMQLTKRGRNWFGLCPFHGEQTPSFSVSQDKQIFHCFGCGAGGNAITFVMDIENIAFPDAVLKLANRVGMPVDVAIQPTESTAKSVPKEQKEMLEAHEFACDFYHHLLVNTEDGEAALQYLLDRGFTRELIESQKIGWALNSWDALSTLLSRKNLQVQNIVDSGLIIQKDQDGSYFDRFRNRIMFPIRDENGKVIAFSGRILQPSENEPKYLNSPESPIFHKSEILYNLDKARASIRKSKKIILMEGFVDVLAANRAGVFNAVATMGTSLTPQHIQKIKRLAQQVTICYDGDRAGTEAAKRAAQMLYDERVKMDIAVIPNQMDPDDYIRDYGEQAFKEQILDNPHSFVAFMKMVARRGKNLNFEADTEQYIQEVLDYLVGNTSPIERDIYITQLSNETNVGKEAIEATFRKKELAQSKEQKRVERVVESVVQLPTTSKILTATERAERLLLHYMLQDESLVEKVVQQCGRLNPFVHDAYKAVFVKLSAFYEEYINADYHRFVEILDDAELRRIVMDAALLETDENTREQEIADCLKQFERHHLEIELKNVEHEREEAERMFEFQRALELLQKSIEINRKLKNMKA